MPLIFDGNFVVTGPHFDLGTGDFALVADIEPQDVQQWCPWVGLGYSHHADGMQGYIYQGEYEPWRTGRSLGRSSGVGLVPVRGLAILFRESGQIIANNYQIANDTDRVQGTLRIGGVSARNAWFRGQIHSVRIERDGTVLAEYDCEPDEQMPGILVDISGNGNHTADLGGALLVESGSPPVEPPPKEPPPQGIHDMIVGAGLDWPEGLDLTTWCQTVNSDGSWDPAMDPRVQGRPGYGVLCAPNSCGHFITVTTDGRVCDICFDALTDEIKVILDGEDLMILDRAGDLYLKGQVRPMSEHGSVESLASSTMQRVGFSGSVDEFRATRYGGSKQSSGCHENE